jgi:lipoprotein signal peptidase
MIINNGASLGLNFPFLEVVSGFLLVVIGVLWWREKKAWGWGLIMAGGGLNLAERIIWGGVKDYWQIPLTSIYNNINDYLIAGGVIQLIWYILWKKRQK